MRLAQLWLQARAKMAASAMLQIRLSGVFFTIIVIITTSALAVRYWEVLGGAAQVRAAEIDSGIFLAASHLDHLELDAATALVPSEPAFRLRFPLEPALQSALVFELPFAELPVSEPLLADAVPLTFLTRRLWVPALGLRDSVVHYFVGQTAVDPGIADSARLVVASPVAGNPEILNFPNYQSPAVLSVAPAAAV